MFRVLWKMLFPHYTGGQGATVRYAFPLVIGSIFFVSLASVISENTSYVTIETDAKTVSKDEQFIVSVLATAHVPINAVDLVISYPEDKIAIDGIDTGTSVITIWTEKPYAEDGSIYIRGGTFRQGFIGEHTIARIKAHAVSSGEARILIKDTQFLAGDGRGTEVPAASSLSNAVKIKVSGSDGVISGKVALSIITDIDGDGDVDLKDISAFMAAWFSGHSTFDFNKDGRVTFSDFSIILADAFFK
jgi:hypothetical protein